MILINGGILYMGLTGNIHWVRQVILMEWMIFPSCMLPGKTRLLMQHGQEKDYPPKPNGSLLPEEVRAVNCMRGAINLNRMENGWPTYSKGPFPNRMLL